MDALSENCAALQDAQGAGGAAATTPLLQRKRRREEDDDSDAKVTSALSGERDSDAKRQNQGGDVVESDAALEQVSALPSGSFPFRSFAHCGWRAESMSNTNGVACVVPEQSQETTVTPDHSAQEAAPSLLRVAIIVPFRDSHPAQKRQAHLDKFVPHMTALLTKQKELSAFHIFIMEQSLDGRKFNRGKLLNAGFDIARNDYDVFIFHDVDLLPGDSDLFVGAFSNSSPRWGGEDDELYCRVLKKKLAIHSPLSGTITDLEEMKLEDKLETLRATKWKCTVKRELLKEHVRTWKRNGIKSLHYTYVDAVALNDFCTKITVDLGSNDHWSDARSSLDVNARPPQRDEETEETDNSSDQIRPL